MGNQISTARSHLDSQNNDYNQETNDGNQETNDNDNQETNNNNEQNNIDNEEDGMEDLPLEDLRQFPIACVCITDYPRPNTRPPPRIMHIALRMPRVPFVVNRRLYSGGPNTCVTCGVVLVSICNNYEDFMLELRIAFQRIFGEALGGTLSSEIAIPGYETWYEMMGPVERRVAFGSHPWSVFKARVRLVVLYKT